MHNEEWNALFGEEMRKMDGCDSEKFSTLDCSKTPIAVLGDRCWPEDDKQEGSEIHFFLNVRVIRRRSVMSARMLEVLLLGVGTVPRLESDA